MPSLGLTHPSSPQLGLQRKKAGIRIHDMYCIYTWIESGALTHVVSDNGEGFEVGFPDVLGQSVGIVLKIAK